MERYFEDIHKNRKFLANQYYKIGYALGLLNKVREARNYFFKAFFINPLNIKYAMNILISFFGQSMYIKVHKSYKSIVVYISNFIRNNILRLNNMKFELNL